MAVIQEKIEGLSFSPKHRDSKFRIKPAAHLLWKIVVRSPCLFSDSNRSRKAMFRCIAKGKRF